MRLYYPISAKSAEAAVYFTDRGIEELGERRGEEQVTLGWLTARLRAFVDQHPGFDFPVDWLRVRQCAVSGLPGSGTPDELMEAVGISASHIAAAARELLKD
jgi:hypothetical protein